MLAGAGLGDEFLLAHVFGQQAFAHAVVKLVGAGVVQIFSLEIDPGAANFFGKAFAVIDRGGAALEVGPDVAELPDEIGGLADLAVGRGDLLHLLFQRTDVDYAAELAVKAVGVGEIMEIIVGISLS